ncbi:hypothetical protein [Saccharolobus sp. A20]|uniref:hypothetical protein n=1 Tax=Saccharolobus sp. A20 TaxID=1891280 RepID=UPI0012E9C1FB|nr:hypothetical protein [Sulfolobus sp. A20]
MSNVVVFKADDRYVRIPTRLDDDHNYESSAESMQRKYDRKWKEGMKISNHKKAKNII